MTENHIPFVGISSGYDSGAIHASLLKTRRQFLGISVSGMENTALLFERQALSNQAAQTHLVLDDHYVKTSITQLENFIEMSVEDLPYKIQSDARTIRGEPKSVLNDKASKALAVIASIARRAGSIINISGSGADETISDYGYNGIPIFQHSNFGGLWPNNLHDIFPWASFNYSTQQAYLWKEEAVGGAFSVENRYPFLDKGVVQAYLNLTPDLKNMRYKAPISFYLESCNYPYRKEKLGFSPFKKGDNYAA